MQKGVWAGEKIAKLRRARAISQEELAHAAGLRRTDVNRYERNRARLGALNAEKIARALGVTPADLGVTPGNGRDAVSSEQLERIAGLLDEMSERLGRIDARLAQLERARSRRTATH